MIKLLIVLMVIGLSAYGFVSAYEDIKYNDELTLSEEIREQCLDGSIRNLNFQEVDQRQCLKESIYNG